MNDNFLQALVAVVVGVAALGVLVDARGPDPANDRDPGVLRVATYNVHQWHTGDGSGRHNLEAVRDALVRTGADIIGLQESEGSRVSSGGIDGPRWLARAMGHHHVAAPPSSAGSYGLAILSRWPIHDATTVELPRGADTIERHLLLVRTGPAADTWVAVTHFEIEQHPDVRLEQAVATVDALAHLTSVVLLGDFNSPASEDDAAYQRLAASFTDAWLAAGHAEGTGATSPVPGAEVRIDHVWLRGHGASGAGIFGGPAASDHHGVWADLGPMLGSEE